MAKLSSLFMIIVPWVVVRFNFDSPFAAMPTTQGSARAAAVSGGFSFEGDSLPDFSEFDSNSVVLDYQNER